MNSSRLGAVVARVAPIFRPILCARARRMMRRQEGKGLVEEGEGLVEDGERM